MSATGPMPEGYLLLLKPTMSIDGQEYADINAPFTQWLIKMTK